MQMLGKSNNIADRNSTLYVCMLVECFAGSRHALMVQFVRSELVADTCSSNRVGPSNRNPFVLLHLILIVILNSNRIRIAHALMMRHYLHMPQSTGRGTRDEAVQKGLTLAGVVCSLALNEVKYVRTVTVTTIYACYITIDLSRRHCHVPFFCFFFKGLAQLALCHVLDQKLYDIGWFSHRRRNSTCGRRSLNTGANVSSSAVGSTLCSSLLYPPLLLSSLLFRSISLC